MLEQNHNDSIKLFSLLELLVDYKEASEKNDRVSWADAKIFTLYNDAIRDPREINSDRSLKSFLSGNGLRENNANLEAVTVRI